MPVVFEYYQGQEYEIIMHSIPCTRIADCRPFAFSIQWIHVWNLDILIIIITSSMIL